MSYRESIKCWHIENIFYSKEKDCEKLIEKKVIALGLDKEIDLKNEINTNRDIEEFIEESCKNKNTIKKFTKVKVGDYFKYSEYYEDGDGIINKTECIGEVIGDFYTHYEHDSDLGHTLPVKWINKYTHVLKHSTYTSELNKLEKKDMNKYLVYLNLENDNELIEELKNTKSKIYGVKNELYDNKYSDIGNRNIRISINNKKILNTLKSIKKDDYIIFINREISPGNKNSPYIEYRGICKVKNGFSIESIKYEGLDCILDIEHIRECVEYTGCARAFSMFVELQDEKLLYTNILNKPLNTILYGPPGTGKTYNTYNECFKVFNTLAYKEFSHDRENINKFIKVYLEKEVLKFSTFHQSYGYEEFIEGLKSDGKGNFKVEDGIFKEIAMDALYEGLKLEIKLDYEIEKDSLSKEESKNRKKQLVLENIHNKDKFDFNGAMNYIIVIDEINRGNISKIFGELITLLEEDKRLTKENEILVKLPYSKEFFCLPPNLYIVGTMNTSDKSIALIDVALRRRFYFKEMMPNHQLLKKVDDIELDRMLEMINKRIEFLYDRDYMIGHAYLINVENFRDISDVFKNKIIPLLQEYFYDDWEKIGLILGGIGRSEKDDYIVYKKEIQSSDLFKDSNIANRFENKTKYYIKEDISKKELRNIYE